VPPTFFWKVIYTAIRPVEFMFNRAFLCFSKIFFKIFSKKADKYFTPEQSFKVLGRDIIVKNESIAEALRTLSKRDRNIILLSYFLEMSDGEIGKKLNLVRSNVQYYRTNTLKELKKLLEEENADE